jgi:5-bromo-4-chloroindolyl phosphate hydrolysis protein
MDNTTKDQVKVIDTFNKFEELFLDLIENFSELKEKVSRLENRLQFLERKLGVQKDISNVRNIEDIYQNIKEIYDANKNNCNFYNVIEWFNIQGISVPMSVLKEFDYECKKFCEDNQKAIIVKSFPEFWEINTYPEEVLMEVTKSFDWDKFL